MFVALPKAVEELKNQKAKNNDSAYIWDYFRNEKVDENSYKEI